MVSTFKATDNRVEKIEARFAPPVQLSDASLEEKSRCESSLLEFTKACWGLIDNGRFVDNWHLAAISEHLEAIARGDIKNLLLCMPPRHGKSLLASIVFPAWVWTQQQHALAGPKSRLAYLSYGERLAERFSDKTRDIVENAWYTNLWPHIRLSEKNNKKTEFSNTLGGERLAFTTGGALTGFGADIFCIDDPHNIQTDSDGKREDIRRIWTEALPLRRNSPESAFIITMQRSHLNDLAGVVYEQLGGKTFTEVVNEDGRKTYSGWVPLILPAAYDPTHPHPFTSPVVNKATGELWKDERQPGELLWPERWSAKDLEDHTSGMTSYAKVAQLQQNPIARQSGIMKAHMFGQPVDSKELPKACTFVNNRVRAWDLAATAAKDVSWDPDYTVGILMARAGSTYYICDMVRIQETPGKVRETVKDCSLVDCAAVSIPHDPGQAGTDQIREYARLLVGQRLDFDKTRQQKARRSEAFIAQVEAGNVRLVRGYWNTEFLDEVLSYPNAPHDDILDACASAYRFLVVHTTSRLTGVQGSPDEPGYERVNGCWLQRRKPPNIVVRNVDAGEIADLRPLRLH